MLKDSLIPLLIDRGLEGLILGDFGEVVMFQQFYMNVQKILKGIYVIQEFRMPNGKKVRRVNPLNPLSYLVIVGSVLTFIAFIYMLQKLPPEINSIYAYINPIIAVLLGALVFGEPLTIAIAIGGGITLCGLYMVNYSMRKARI